MQAVRRAGFPGWGALKASPLSTSVACLLFALGCASSSGGSGGATGLGAEGGATDSSAEGGATSMGGEPGVAAGGNATAGERAVAACDGLPWSEMGGASACGITAEHSVAPSDCRLHLPVPPGEEEFIDLNFVELRFAPSAEPEQRLPHVESVAACEGAPHGGWYADPSNLADVRLCPCTCARLTMPGITITYLGCGGQFGIR